MGIEQIQQDDELRGRQDNDAPTRVQGTIPATTIDAAMELLIAADTNFDGGLDHSEMFGPFSNLLAGNAQTYAESLRPQITVGMRRMTPEGETVIEESALPNTAPYNIHDTTILNEHIIATRLARVTGLNEDEIAARINKALPNGVEDITLLQFLERNPSFENMRPIPRTSLIQVGPNYDL